MRELLIFSILSLITWSAVSAQTLDKQLEVTREYTPRIDRAVKLAVAPQMIDTVRLRPVVAYQINSVASETSFAVKPYEPATIKTSPGGATGQPLYLRAGIGWPIVTDFDLYLTPEMRGGTTLGLFVNHDGSFSKIRNDLGIKKNATQMANGAGVWFGQTWRSKSLDIDASYDSRLYNPYGMAGDEHTQTSESAVYHKVMERFILGLARVGVSFGDNFTDLSRLNFRIAMDGGYAHGNNKKQSKYDIKITVAKMLGSKWGFEFGLEDRMAFPRNIHGNAVTVSVLPRIIYTNGRLGVKFGADGHYIRNKAWSDQDRFLITPMADARINFANGAFVPFASLTSHILDGDYEALTRRNPYIVAGGPTAYVNDLRIGVGGDLNDRFTYKAFVGVSFFRDYQIFTGVQLPKLREAAISYPAMWFMPVGVDGSRWTAGAEISLRRLAGFGARAYGNWNEFQFSGGGSFSPVGDLPNYDAGIELSWAYKSVFSIRTGVEFIGERDYLVRNSGLATELYKTGVIRPVMDITFGVDVRVRPDLWVFVEGENLANQELYPYPHYRGLGTSVLGGVKILF